jgi:hypothetical protein
MAWANPKSAHTHAMEALGVGPKETWMSATISNGDRRTAALGIYAIWYDAIPLGYSRLVSGWTGSSARCPNCPD